MTMKFLLNILFITLFTFSLSAQVDNQIDFKTYFQEKDLEPEKGDHDLFFQIEKKGKGQKPKSGDYVKIHYKGMLMDGTVFDESEKDDPYVFRLGHRLVIKGWDNGLQLFSEGSKGTLYVPYTQGYGDKGIADVIPKKAKRLPSGMSYVITKKGKGENAKKGDYIEVHYEGQLIDGSVFDSSYEKGQPFKFTLGRRKAIEGWEEGLLNFKKGSEGWLIVPSQMAYGPREIREGKTHIPANSVLVFKIKVVDLKSKEAKAKKK